MSTKSESIKRQKKQQRKALKRNRVHKIFRTQKNRWNDLGKDKQHISKERARHTANLYRGLENVEQMIKRWGDKIPQEKIDLFHQLKEDVLIAKKTKVKDILDKAIAAILPVAQEIEKIYKENEAPVEKPVVPVDSK